MDAVSLWAMDQHTSAHLVAQRKGRDLLRFYITQQQALEADTVSRTRLVPLLKVRQKARELLLLENDQGSWGDGTWELGRQELESAIRASEAMEKP